MLDIETVTRNSTAKTMRLVEASPEALRECADRIDLASRNRLPGDSVMCELTPGIHVVHVPLLDHRPSLMDAPAESGVTI